MKSLAIMTCLWGLVAIASGVMGSAWLRTNWQEREAADFSSDLKFVLAVIDRGTWREPWETDPAWSQMERGFDLEVVPARLASNANRDRLESGPEWSRSPAGKLSLNAGVLHTSMRSTVEPSEAVFLQFTRQVEPDNALRIWWISWGATNLVGVGLAAFVWVERRQHLRFLDGLLAPWLTAIRYGRVSANYLPAIETDSALEPSLRIVAENVNQTIVGLLGENERSELVLGNLQEGVLAIDARTRVLLTNNALRRLLHLPEEACLDRPLAEVVRLPMVHEVVEYVLSQQTPHEELLELNDPQRCLRVLGRPLPLRNNQSGALITVRDETLIHRIESLRRDFVTNASHELKTPLAAIRAYAETLQMGALEDRATAEQFVGNIIEQADRINGLVQGMLQLSRVEAGTALKIEKFDARQALEPCIAAAEAVARSKSVRVEPQWSPGSHDIRCDRGGFQTIASNLLSNAVRYTPEGGLVSVLLKKEGFWLVLSVTDTGIGIAPQELERIFERFYRAQKDRSADTGGTGLGLSIVKHLTQALGGEVVARSRQGEGSCFEVRLPVEG
jgi:two-component system phosphate regulon sensor histidine kinase PhoR